MKGSVAVGVWVQVEAVSSSDDASPAGPPDEKLPPRCAARLLLRTRGSALRRWGPSRCWGRCTTVCLMMAIAAASVAAASSQGCCGDSALPSIGRPPGAAAGDGLVPRRRRHDMAGAARDFACGV